MKGRIIVQRKDGIVEFSGDFRPEMSVIAILEELNARTPLCDINGKEVPLVEYECSCRQGTCGACAMLINEIPRLACSTFFRDAGPVVKLAPLSKFPVISDLKVDRSAIPESVKTMKLWLNDDEAALAGDVDLQYSSGECMFCGCCLEACPNYSGKDAFFGGAGMNACYHIVSQTEDAAHKKEHLSAFTEHGSSGCSISLACERVCPAHIPHSLLISLLNRELFRSQ